MRMPIKIKLTRKCRRCGLRYPVAESACTHCTGLTDQEVRQLKARYDEEHKGNANLGRLFIYVAVVIMVLTLLIAMN